MSNFPDRWLTSSVGAINRYSSRNVDPKSAPEVDFDLYSVPIFPEGKPEKLRGSEIGSTKQTVEPADVLICKINPRINRVWMVGARKGRPQIASSEWIAVRAPEFDARFLKHYFTSPSFRELIEDGVSGVGGSLTRAQPKRVATFPVPVAPKEEQRRIADKLDSVLSRVSSCRERLERLPQVLKQLREAILEAAISGRLTQEWRGQSAASATNQTIVLEDESLVVPKDWSACRLGDSISESRPLCYGVVQPGPDIDAGQKLVRVQDIERGRIAVDGLRTISVAVDREYQRSRIQAGDLLVSVVGSIGRTAVVPEGLHANIARAIARIAPREGVDSKWLSIWLNSIKLQWWLLRSSKEVARKTLNLSDLERAPLALPPLTEQREIVRRVDELFALADALEHKYQVAFSKVERLTPAVLAKAFRGELVPQDSGEMNKATVHAIQKAFQ